MINMTNVLDGILRHLKERFREPITSAFGLSKIIMARRLGLNFNQVEWYHERYCYLEIFKYSINYVVSRILKARNNIILNLPRRTRRHGVLIILRIVARNRQEKMRKRREGEKEGWEEKDKDGKEAKGQRWRARKISRAGWRFETFW